MTDLKSLQNINAMARNPDALYASALGALHLSPEITAVFSPIAKAVFDVGYSVASKMAGDAMSQLGKAMLSTAIEVVGKDATKMAVNIASDVAGAVAGAIPILSTMINLCMIAGGIGAAETAAAEAYQHKAVEDFLAGAKMPGSGKGGYVMPADLFAPYTELWTIGTPEGRAFQWYRPYHPIGACLVALTEDAQLWGKMTTGADGAYDNNLMHTRDALALASQRWAVGRWAEHLGLADPNGDVHGSDEHPGLAPGIPVARREAYRALRMAIGSHSEGDKHGEALFTLYMDMLAEDFAAGRLTSGWFLFLLTHVYVLSDREPAWIAADTLVTDLPSDQQGDFRPLAPCSMVQFSAIVSQITDMVAAYEKHKNAKRPLDLHLHLPAALVLLAEARSRPSQALTNSAYSPASRLAVLRYLAEHAPLAAHRLTPHLAASLFPRKV